MSWFPLGLVAQGTGFGSPLFSSIGDSGCIPSLSGLSVSTVDSSQAERGRVQGWTGLSEGYCRVCRLRDPGHTRKRLEAVADKKRLGLKSDGRAGV